MNCEGCQEACLGKLARAQRRESIAPIANALSRLSTSGADFAKKRVLNLELRKGDQCVCGLNLKDKTGEFLAAKTTGWMSCSRGILHTVKRTCGHKDELQVQVSFLGRDMHVADKHRPGTMCSLRGPLVNRLRQPWPSTQHGETQPTESEIVSHMITDCSGCISGRDMADLTVHA